MSKVVDLAMSVTKDQVEALMYEAGQAGDAAQVAVCLVALDRCDDGRVEAQRGSLEGLGIVPEHIDADVRAQAECARVIGQRSLK